MQNGHVTPPPRVRAYCPLCGRPPFHRFSSSVIRPALWSCLPQPSFTVTAWLHFHGHFQHGTVPCSSLLRVAVAAYIQPWHALSPTPSCCKSVSVAPAIDSTLPQPHAAWLTQSAGSSGRSSAALPMGEAAAGSMGTATWGQLWAKHKIPLILFYYGFCSSTLIVSVEMPLAQSWAARQRCTKLAVAV